MALFELTDLAAYLQQDVDTASATIARTMATALITNYTNQNIEAATYTHLLPIVGNATIRLPQRPVTDVTSVTVAGTTLTEGTDWDWDGITALVVLDGYVPPTEESWQATVVYDAGYDTVPGDITAVALALAGQFYTQTPGVASESIDDYRVSYTGSGISLDGYKPILAKYKMRLGSITPTATVPTRMAAVGVSPQVVDSWRWQA